MDLRDTTVRDWEKFARYYEQLKEPARTPISLESLDLRADQHAHNIRQVLQQATPDEVDYWGYWYHQASDECRKLAERHNVSLPLAAAVTAALSPGNKWWINIRIADQLLTFWEAGALERMPKLSAYPISLQKAIKILDAYKKTGKVDTTEIDTPKVGIFYNSLVDPEGVDRDIVLDGHAINIARGIKRGLKGVRTPAREERRAIEMAYKRVADEFALTVQAVQAITWFIWRFVKGDKAKAAVDGV